MIGLDNFQNDKKLLGNESLFPIIKLNENIAMKKAFLFLPFLLFLSFNCADKTSLHTSSADISKTIFDLQNWLNTPENERLPLEELDFSKEKLTKSEAAIATKLLFEDKQKSISAEYEKQWEDRTLQLKAFKMPFYYQVHGDKPTDGRSLFISLHGGGGAPASVNDQQYTNQKHLYDATMENLEGVYLAPRAPTNTWNLWHENHIDDFLNIIIQMAIIKEEVNPNKIYLLGYSAGGDGVYQLAPRIADRFAAACMMAGHPNDASPLGLRNIPFAIHMGALDSAYDRNKVAKKWGNLLNDLQKNDPNGYNHDVQIHEGLSHWMQLKDSVALPWMSKYKRNPLPQKVVWKQSSRHHSTFYWVKTPEEFIETNGAIKVSYNSKLNEINIEENYASFIQVFLNDKMLNLDKPITIKYKNKKIYQGVFNRNILNIQQTLAKKGDLNFAFSSSVSIKNNQMITDN